MKEENKNPADHHPSSIIRHPLYWYIATWFGCGELPASGTMGSLGALPFAFLIQRGVGAGFHNVILGNITLFAASLIMFCVGWWASNEYLKQHNNGDDPKQIVVDEVAGQWLLLSVLFPTWHSYLIGFVLFRTFDIVKPWPISVADAKIKGGIGVMFDDMLAALYPILIVLFILIEAQLFGSHKLLLPVMNFLGGSYVQR